MRSCIIHLIKNIGCVWYTEKDEHYVLWFLFACLLDLLSGSYLIPLFILKVTTYPSKNT